MGFHFAFGVAFACVKRMSFPTDTIAALATPVGTSAIAVVRVSGSQSLELARTIFQGTPPPRVARHADYRDGQGQVIDDVLFTYFAGPHSFTGEDSLEISCHGNPFIAQKVLEDLLSRGCQPAEAGEFSKRAFLNGRMNLSQAEAIMDLIHARSERALAVANQQLRGALERRMDELISLLVKILANIEAYIDFPEEDLPAEDRGRILSELDKLLAGTKQLLATSHYGELLRDGIKTVIVGEPNAGKSSLLNRLVGRERALVSAEPGTTRDYLEERIILGPHGLRLIDTAGLNPSPGVLEKQGIDKALEQASAADLFLWVIDSSRPLTPLPPSVAERMRVTNTIVVYNKTDLPLHAASEVGTDFSSVRISALHGTDLNQLQRVVTKLADAFQANVGDDLIAINARHSHALEQAEKCLARVKQQLMNEPPSELVASDLRGALESFGEISGKVDNEKILDELFATFCIGK
jgi:tRNA modification GTPase